MATYAEMIYAVLDLLKERSDDAYYTEEHVMFFLDKIRALLLERRYKVTRNGVHQPVSDENKQQICLKVVPAEMTGSGCDGNWMKSVGTIPPLVGSINTVTCTGHDLLPTMVTFIPKDRMPYVGYNRWLKNIVYASRSADSHLYLHGANPQFMYLDMVGLTGVFADSQAAEKLAHDVVTGQTQQFDIMQRPFPLESSLVAQCIEMVVQELIGSRYAPEDKDNNAKDDLGELAQASNSAPSIARRTARDAEEEEQ